MDSSMFVGMVLLAVGLFSVTCFAAFALLRLRSAIRLAEQVVAKKIDADLTAALQQVQEEKRTRIAKTKPMPHEMAPPPLFSQTFVDEIKTSTVHKKTTSTAGSPLSFNVEKARIPKGWDSEEVDSYMAALEMLRSKVMESPNPVRSVRADSQAHGWSPSYIADVLRGRQIPSKSRMLKLLNWYHVPAEANRLVAGLLKPSPKDS